MSSSCSLGQHFTVTVSVASSWPVVSSIVLSMLDPFIRALKKWLGGSESEVEVRNLLERCGVEVQDDPTDRIAPTLIVDLSGEVPPPSGPSKSA